jgi:hypothetical protein
MKIFQVSTSTSSKLFSLYFIIRNMPVSLWVSYAFECFIDVRPIQAPQNIKCVFHFQHLNASEQFVSNLFYQLPERVY